MQENFCGLRTQESRAAASIFRGWVPHAGFSRGLPVVRKSWKALWNEDLVSYRMLARQLPFVMVAHCAFPEVTGDAFRLDLKEMDWRSVAQEDWVQGLVVSDDLEMGGVLKVASIEDAAVQTIAAERICTLSAIRKNLCSARSRQF